jgi:acetyltransferase-like isoleucine patch superfamily enzyme
MLNAKKVWIIGYGGFGFQILSLLLSTKKYRERQIDFAGFIDDRTDAIARYNGQNKNFVIQFGAVKILPNIENVDLTTDKFVFGISDPLYKKTFIEKNNLNSSHFEKLMPNCKGSLGNNFGESILNEIRTSTNVQIGDFNFLDLNSIVGHDCKIGDYNHIGVNVIIGGNVEIGNGCTIHSGATIGRNVKISDNCTIGIGVTVVRDLPPNTKLIAEPPKKV